MIYNADLEGFNIINNLLPEHCKKIKELTDFTRTEVNTGTWKHSQRLVKANPS